MFTAPAIAVLVIIATLGHAMAFVWYMAARNNWKICARTIYDLPIKDIQLRRELINSLHTPMHAIILGIFLALGSFQDRTPASFVLTALVTTIWAEIWHYGSHRAFHLSALHWIHVEHHKSHISSPFTAISFSFTEKLIFDIGLVGALALLDLVVSLNFYGVTAWYIGYLVINSFSHANFEMKPRGFNRVLGQVITSTAYHSLHHSRYTGNYGLGTRTLDRIFKTEWEDYERLYARITEEQRPLTRLRERVDAPVRT